MRLCLQQPEVRRVVKSGPTSTVVVLSEGVRLSLVAVLPPQFASALLHATGSTAHLTALRREAQNRGLLLTKHGLTQREGGRYLCVAEEQDIYHHLGFPYIAPELREDRGELEAAEAGHLPTLVTVEDIQGDLHVHSNWGEGTHSLEEIAPAAQRMGYRYVAICDYALSSVTGRGLSPQTLVGQIEAIRRLNAELPEAFQLLAGAEVEISPDGGLDFDTGVLHELDVVVAAMHTGFKEPRSKITRRLCMAMEHPLVSILAHPAGRMLGRPETLCIDIEALLETAAETQTCLEINSHVLRLDLQDIYVQRARDLGVTFSLGSDASAIQEMRTMRLGVYTARRGWVEPGQLLNTLPYQRLLQRLQDREVTNVA